MVGSDKPLIGESRDIFSDWGDCVKAYNSKFEICEYFFNGDNLEPKEINLFKVKLKIEGINYETL